MFALHANDSAKIVGKLLNLPNKIRSYTPRENGIYLDVSSSFVYGLFFAKQLLFSLYANGCWNGLTQLLKGVVRMDVIV